MKKHPWTPIIIMIVLGIVILGVHSSVSPAQTKANSSVTPSSSMTSTAPPNPQVLLDQSGSGSVQTAPFITGQNWTLTYTFDCSNTGVQGNFIVNVKNTDGSVNADAGPNDLAGNGGNTGYFYDAGQHYLQIMSECSWHVVVKG